MKIRLLVILMLCSILAKAQTTPWATTTVTSQTRTNSGSRDLRWIWGSSNIFSLPDTLAKFLKKSDSAKYVTQYALAHNPTFLNGYTSNGNISIIKTLPTLSFSDGVNTISLLLGSSNFLNSTASYIESPKYHAGSGNGGIWITNSQIQRRNTSGATIDTAVFQTGLSAQLAAITSGVSSFNGRPGAVIPLVGDYSAFYAPITGGGYVPSSRTLHNGFGINTIGDLSADRTVTADTSVLTTKATAQNITGSKTFTPIQYFGSNSETPNILGIGTSLLTPFGFDNTWNYSDNYGYKIAALLGYSFNNQGVTGKTVIQVGSGGTNSIYTYATIIGFPTYVNGNILELEIGGINDAINADTTDYNLTIFRSQLNTIISRAVAAGYPLNKIFCEIPAYWTAGTSARNDSFVAASVSVCTTAGVLFFDGYDKYKSYGWTYNGGLHPTQAEQTIIANDMYTYLQSQGVPNAVVTNNILNYGSTQINGTLNNSGIANLSGNTTINTLNLNIDRTIRGNVIGDIYARGATGYTIPIPAAISGVLTSNGTGTVPSYQLLSLTAGVTGVLPIANGGTGSGTQSFVDLSTTQTVAGNKTFTGSTKVTYSDNAFNNGFQISNSNTGNSAISGIGIGTSSNGAIIQYIPSTFGFTGANSVVMGSLGAQGIVFEANALGTGGTAQSIGFRNLGSVATNQMTITALGNVDFLKPLSFAAVIGTANQVPIVKSDASAMTWASTTGTGNVVMSASPTFTGTPLVPVPGTNINTAQIAPTQWVNTYFQPILVSGTNIKTIASNSLLGSGNIPLNTTTIDTTHTSTGSFTWTNSGNFASKAYAAANFYPISTNPSNYVKSVKFADSTAVSVTNTGNNYVFTINTIPAIYLPVQYRSAYFIGNGTTALTPITIDTTLIIATTHYNGIIPTWATNHFVQKTTTVAGFSLASNITLASHTPGYGQTGSAYNGSTAQGFGVDTTVIKSKVGSLADYNVLKTAINTIAADTVSLTFGYGLLSSTLPIKLDSATVFNKLFRLAGPAQTSSSIFNYTNNHPISILSNTTSDVDIVLRNQNATAATNIKWGSNVGADQMEAGMFGTSSGFLPGDGYIGMTASASFHIITNSTDWFQIDAAGDLYVKKLTNNGIIQTTGGVGEEVVSNVLPSTATATTQTSTDNSTLVATDAFVKAALPTGATPTGTQGLTAVAGSAITFIRSDATFAFNQALTPTNTASWAWNITGLGATTSDAILFKNTTAAVSGTQQVSPAWELNGNGWATTPAASQLAQARLSLTPIQGASVISSYVGLDFNTNGAGWLNRYQFGYTGILQGASFTSLMNSLGTGNGDGVLLKSTTASTSGATIQNAPDVHQYANIWNTSANVVDESFMHLTGVSAATTSAIEQFQFRINGGSITTAASLTSAGVFTPVTLGYNTVLQSATGGTSDSIRFASSQKMVQKALVQGNGVTLTQTATTFTIAGNPAGMIIGTPTIAAGTGAGTSPTVSVTSNGRGIQVTVTTGTIPTGTNATIATVTLANALSYTPYPVFSSPPGAATLLSAASMIGMSSTGPSNVTITSGTTALTAATTYVWNIAL